MIHLRAAVMTPLSLDLFAPAQSKLTVLSFGAGQDSTVLLEEMIDNPQFRAEHAPNDLLVVCADTGDEFPQTYKHIAYMKQRCAYAGIEFVHITTDMGYHSDSWRSLRHFYRTHGTIGSKAYPKTCTDRLKLQPIYRFLAVWLHERYGVVLNKKEGIRQFAAQHGKIKMMIGIAAGEEKRMTDASKSPKRWYRESIETIYPLVSMGMDRAACQKYLHAKDMYVIPSNCMACPFMSLEELEYLRRFHPESLADLVALEAAKLEKHKDKSAIIVTDAEGEVVLGRDGKPKTVNKNYGVFGLTALPKKIVEAAAKLAEWTDEQVAEYRYSHGHCTSTSF